VKDKSAGRSESAKTLDVCGIGNALVDVLIEVSDEELASLGYAKGSWALIDEDEARRVLARFADRPHALVSGGSVANSLILFTQLGGDAVLFTSLGDDKYGAHFAAEALSYRLLIGSQPFAGQTTGICLSLVTPDAERSMRAFLGAARFLGESHVDSAQLACARWLFLEGYVFSGGEYGQSAIRKALAEARRHDCKVAITFSAAPVVEQHRSEISHAVAQAELVFANEAEAQAYTGARTVEEAFEALAAQVPHTVVTIGQEGALISSAGSRMHVPAEPCVPVDLTGAGDAFAGAYLFGLTRGLETRQAAAQAARLARSVICQVGARLREPRELLAALAGGRHEHICNIILCKQFRVFPLTQESTSFEYPFTAVNAARSARLIRLSSVPGAL